MEFFRSSKEILQHLIEGIYGTGGGVIHSDIPGISRLNESVYEFYRPENGISPEVEVVLFHGVHRGDSKNAYLETWISSDGSTSHCWPKTWVAKSFPKARILSVSYDSSIKKGPTQGRLDLYCLAENLIQDLTYGNVGAQDACPLILVGHGFGGLVIKAVCLEASERRMDSFLCNVKGMLFYSTPQLGLSNVPAEFHGALAKTLGWGNEEIARLNQKFQKLRKAKKWVAKAILAANPGKEPGLDAKEASVRSDVDEFYTAQEDIDSICRPREETSISVKYLTEMLKDCTASRSEPGGATERGVKLTSSLLFENDEYYVPMVHSRNEVQNALNNPGIRIVVLHGLPGSGKSSLAKHLALWFADESNMHCQDQGTMATSSDLGQRSFFTDGVVYLTCEPRADVISKQRELLQSFNVTVGVDNEARLDGDGLQRKLKEHLEHLKALVILDDIWEPELVQKLVVPGQIKYLITTQVTTLWSGSKVKNIPIQDVCQDDARKILGNYAGFCDGIIPDELMEIADELIKATESHPLALATLAMVINDGENTSEEEWEEVRDNFVNCLKSEQRAIGFGGTYPRTVYAAMTSTVDLLNDSEKNLLYTIVLFEGPGIPECIVQLFLESTRPEWSWETMAYPARMRLESLGLVQRVFFSFSFDSVNTLPQKHRAFIIHGLRQQFILSRMHEHSDVSITKFVVKDGSLLHQHEVPECERDLPLVLCSLYSRPDLQKAAIIKLGARFIWLGSNLLFQLRPFLVWLLSVMVKGTRGAPDNQLHTAKAAMEVFWMLFNKGELDDDNMSFLLCGTTTRHSCELFACLSYIFLDTQHALRVAALPSSTNRVIDLFNNREVAIQYYAVQTIKFLAGTIENKVPIVKNFSSLLEGLVPLLSPDMYEGTQKEALKALLSLSCTPESPILMEILGTPGLLENVVMLLSKDSEGRCEVAAQLISNLVTAGQERTIVQFPLCLQSLVALLAPDVDEGAQEGALRAMTKLSQSQESPVLMEILGTSGLLESMVMLLSKDSKGKCEAATDLISNLAPTGQELTIVQFPLCLQRLVALLAPDVDEGAQKAALMAMANLSRTHKSPVLMEILGIPDLLERVVMLLSKDSKGKCEAAAELISNLAPAGQELTIVQFPLCLQKLIALLAPGVDERAKRAALAALGNLANSYKSPVLMKILGTPGLLEGVVRLLSKDTKGVDKAAVTSMCNLSNTEQKLDIVRFPCCLEKLVALLAPDVDEGTQKVALMTLTNLADTHESDVLIEILKTPNLLEGVVLLLSKDMKGKCEVAGQLIVRLARTPGYRVAIAQYPLCLEQLIGLLAPHVDEVISKVGILALAHLGMQDENEVDQKMLVIGNVLGSSVLLPIDNSQARATLSSPKYSIRGAIERLLTKSLVSGNVCSVLYMRWSDADVLLKDYPSALRYITKALEINADNGSLLQKRGILQFSMGDFLGALVDFNKALEVNPDDGSLLQTRGILQLCMGDFSGALVDFNKALEVNPYDGSLLQTRGNLQWCMGDFSGALVDFNKALEVNPDDRSLLQMRGNLQWRIGDFSGALADFNKALEVNRDDGLLLQMRGNLQWCLQMGDFSGALANFNNALEVNVDDGSLLRKRGFLQWRMGDFSGALADFNKALEVNANDESLLRKRGFLLWRMGDFSGALADFNKGLEVNVDDEFTLQERGVLRRFMGDFLGALEDLNRALQLAPHDYELLKHRALVKFMMEDEEGACMDAERAILVKPSRIDNDSYGQDWCGKNSCFEAHGCLGVLSVEFLGYVLK